MRRRHLSRRAAPSLAATFECYNNGWTADKAGIYVTGTSTNCTDNIVANNFCENVASQNGGTNQDYGIVLDGAFRTQVVGNHCLTVNINGIFVNAGSSTQLVGNFIETAQHDGIAVTGAANVQLSGNNIQNCGTGTDNTYSGILITTGSNSAFIEGNMIRKAGTTPVMKYAINVATSDCTGTTITNNDLTASGKTKPINDSGTATFKAGNRYAAAGSTSLLQGRVTLVSGTATVTTTEVLAGDNIILSRVVAGGTLGQLSVGTIVASTSFVINSDNAADTSTVYWKIDH